MRGFVGCLEDLAPGTEFICGDRKYVVIARATQEEARASAEAMGVNPLVVVPGEQFYVVESSVLTPAGANN